MNNILKEYYMKVNKWKIKLLIINSREQINTTHTQALIGVILETVYNFIYLKNKVSCNGKI